MARKEQQKRDTSGGAELAANPFAALSSEAFGEADVPAAAREPAEPVVSKRKQPKKPGHRGRLDLKRVKSGRGGKTVTEISGFTGVSDAEIADLAKRLKASCGVGGTVKGRVVEIQGDAREACCALLEKEGFRCVLAGG